MTRSPCQSADHEDCEQSGCGMVTKQPAEVFVGNLLWAKSPPTVPGIYLVWWCQSEEIELVYHQYNSPGQTWAECYVCLIKPPSASEPVTTPPFPRELVDDH
jgi:hypothetical protein